jgi:hypothetical protein
MNAASPDSRRLSTRRSVTYGYMSTRSSDEYGYMYNTFLPAPESQSSRYLPQKSHHYLQGVVQREYLF